MSFFGYVLVHKDTLEEYRRGCITRQKVIECHRWFAGWKDLDLIWKYLLEETYFGSIDSCRDKYAKVRGTTVYGEKE